MPPYLVGIAGGSGSGKTTLISILQAELGAERVSVISQDDYYLPKESQCCDSNGEVNFDLPTAIDCHRLVQDVDKLKSGESIEFNRYTFNNLNDISERIIVSPCSILIVEGLFVFHYPELRAQFDYRIFLDANANTRFNRRLLRDVNERGYPEEVVRYQWEHHVEPAYRQYLLPHREHAHTVIDNEHEMRKELQPLVDRLRKECELQFNN